MNNAYAKIYDVHLSAELAQEGMDRATESAGPQFAARWDAAIYRAARRLDTFTTDDVWAELWSVHPNEPTHRGANMLRAVIAQWIQKTDRVRPTERAAGHRNPKTVWRSLLR